MRANRVDTLENARKQSASGLKIHLETQAPEFAEILLSTIRPHLGGECPVVIAYNIKDRTWGRELYSVKIIKYTSGFVIIRITSVTRAGPGRLEFSARTTQYA